MDLVTILRRLWRARLLVGVAAVLALLAGYLVAFRISWPPTLHTRGYEVGTASVRILIDTPSSQIVAAAPAGADTLAGRANLVANIMVDGAVKALIAQQAGLRPSQITGIAQSALDQPPAATPKPRSYVLSTNVLTDTSGNQLPIIEVDTQAPDASGAANLANAAVAGVQDYLDSQAASEGVSVARRLHVIGLGPAQATAAIRGSRNMVAAALALFVFVAGCAAILLVPALVRDWRAAAEAERLEVLRGELAPVPRTRARSRLFRRRVMNGASNGDSTDAAPGSESSASPPRATARSHR